MIKKKFILFDSGSMINFSSNSLLSVFEGLKKQFDGEFLITNEIKYEVVDYPIKVKRFEWGAIRIKKLLDDGILKIAEKGFVDGNELKKRAKKIMNISNNTFFTKHKALSLIHNGEAEIIALSQMLTEQKHEVAVVIDERTARVLCEKPENLQKLMTKKLHEEVTANKDNFDLLRGCNIIRSTELAYVAYQKGLIEEIDPRTLEAVIYALKFGGVSISEKEAQAYGNMK